jgi:hypothetical protein
MGRFRKMVRCIRYRPGAAPEKMILTVMVLAILILPRPAGLPIAKFLCDPSSR